MTIFDDSLDKITIYILKRKKLARFYSSIYKKPENLSFQLYK